jgi:hypothetical protein
MEAEAPQTNDITRLMGDEYVERILSTTHRNPMTAQDLSRVCGIPIAVAYRRIGNLKRTGLLKCVAQEEVPRARGKKVSYYQCAVRTLKVTFVEGRFLTELELLPEEDMIRQPRPSARILNSFLTERKSEEKSNHDVKYAQPDISKNPEDGPSRHFRRL